MSNLNLWINVTKKYFLKKQVKQVIYVLILICIFILTLRPITGMLGGLIYLLLGRIIPSLIVVMIAYYLTSHFIKNEKHSIKIMGFIVFTFIIGLNTNLPYALHLISYQPTDFKIQVIRPIHMGGGKNIGLGSLNNKDIPLLSSPFIYMGVGGDEGCMCLYFQYSNWDMLLNKTWSQLVNNGKISAGYGYGRFDKQLNYFNVLYRMQNTYNGVLLTMHIFDKEYGHIILEAKYPRALKASSNNKVLMNDPRSLSYTISLLLHDNFWTWFFEYFFSTDTPYDLMVKSNVDWAAK